MNLLPLNISSFSDPLSFFFEENFSPTQFLLKASLFALLAKSAYGSHTQKVRTFQKIETPAPPVRDLEGEKRHKETIQKAQEENERLKDVLSEFEGGAFHPLLDCPKKCGLTALKEENQALRSRIARYLPFKNR